MVLANEVLKFLMSAAGGALIGGAFGIANKVLDAWSERRRIEHEIKLRRVDLEIMRAEYEGAAIIRSTEPANGGLEQSYAHDLKGGGKKAEAFRGLVRPVLTGVLTFSAIWMCAYVIVVSVAYWPQMTLDQRFGVLWAAIDWMGFQSSTAITWWYGSRAEHVKRS